MSGQSISVTTVNNIKIRDIRFLRRQMENLYYQISLPDICLSYIADRLFP